MSKKVREAEEVFKDCMKDYFLPPEATAVEPLIPWSPMPGGALTANTQMLRDNNIMEKYPEVIMAMGDVVRKGGYGTSVTPVSQFYFQQAFNNVMFGPWKKIAEPYGKMVLGYFGKTPVEPDAEVVQLASEQLQLKPTTRPVLELNDADDSKGVDAATAVLKAERLPVTDENIFIAAACKEKGIRFLKGEAEVGVRKIDKDQAQSTPPVSSGGGPAEYVVTVNGEDIFMAFEGNMVTVDGKVYRVGIKPQAAQKSAGPAPTDEGSLTEVQSQMPGAVYKQLVHVGDHVHAGEAILVLEAMKMEMGSCLTGRRDGRRGSLWCRRSSRHRTSARHDSRLVEFQFSAAGTAPDMPCQYSPGAVKRALAVSRAVVAVCGSVQFPPHCRYTEAGFEGDVRGCVRFGTAIWNGFLRCV